MRYRTADVKTGLKYCKMRAAASGGGLLKQSPYEGFDVEVGTGLALGTRPGRVFRAEALGLRRARFADVLEKVEVLPARSPCMYARNSLLFWHPRM